MKRKVLASVIALGMAFSLAACGSSASSSSTAAAPAAEEETKEEEAVEAVAETASTEQVEAEVATEEAAADQGAGFEEIPIWEDEEVGFMNVNGVYFQPVPMSDGNSYEDFNMHFEADVSALDNNLGYGLGDWIPYLTVDYDIIGSNGESAASGTFMPMSASDGPHYGANIKLPDADTYSVKLTFHSPAENNYLLHLDSETGPGGTWEEWFPNGDPLVLELKDVWNYTPQEW